MGLGEGLGLVGGLGLVCLVAVDGGLVVGSLALRGLLAGERRLGQVAQRVEVTGWVGLALLGWGGSGANRTRVDRLEPDWCGADQTWYGGSQKRRPAG